MDDSVTVGYKYEYKVHACVDGVFGGYTDTVALTAK